MTTTPPADWDSPWKETLLRFLPEALALLLPALHALIDWTRPYEPLDKELQQIAPTSLGGRRVVDLLLRVWRRDGTEAWLLLHIEIQGQRAGDFAQRMFAYHYRLLDHFDRDVLSIALLTDGHRRWRPDRYVRGGAFSQVRFTYTVVKLLDWRDRLDDLAASANPFAVVVRAHLLALATRRAPAVRLAPKLALVRELYRRGYDQQQVRDLFLFIDWVVRLPEPEDDQFWVETLADEEVRRMPYMLGIERRGIAKGRTQGLEEGRAIGMVMARQGAAVALRAKFGAEAEPLVAMLDEVQTERALGRVLAALTEDAPLSQVRTVLRRARSPK